MTKRKEREWMAAALSVRNMVIDTSPVKGNKKVCDLKVESKDHG